jgi:transposase
MGPKLTMEARMTIAELTRRGQSHCGVAQLLGVTESTVRYHLERQASGAVDGRIKVPRAAPYHPAIQAWVEALGAERPVNLAALHDHLVEEFGYAGSLRSVERYCRKHFPKPRLRARRRVETPPGAQAQVDWAHFPAVRISGELVAAFALHLQLSWSRFGVIVWARSKDQLAWLHAHNEAFRRIGGVPATLRIDNEKTAISHGAGAWGEIHPVYRRYAQAVRFHVDACPPRSPRASKARSSVASSTSDFPDWPCVPGIRWRSCSRPPTRSANPPPAGAGARSQALPWPRPSSSRSRSWVRCRCCQNRLTSWLPPA